MPSLAVKPTHKPVALYYESLARFAKLGIKHEFAVRTTRPRLLLLRLVKL